MNEKNELEDLEFFDFDTSLTISETAFKIAENNNVVSRPCVNFYTYCDSSNDFDLDIQVLLDLPKVIKVKEWLDKFIAKHSENIEK